MPLLIPGTNDAHTLATLTDTINRTPFIPGMIGDLGWEDSGVPTRAVLIDRRNETLDVIDEAPVGAAAQQVKIIEDETLDPLYVPRYPLAFTVRPQEVSGVRAYGQEQAFEMTEDRQARFMSTWRNSVNLTWEFLSVGYLRGKVLDRYGSVRHDVAAKFGVAPTQFAFDFSGTGNFYKFVNDCKAVLQAYLGNFNITGWKLIAGKAVHDKIVYHPSVQESYIRYQEGAFLRRDAVAPFVICDDVQVLYYRNQIIPNSRTAQNPAGTPVFPTDRFILVPICEGLFQRRFAPAEMLGFVNTPGAPVYLSPYDLPHGRGIEIEGETNPIGYVKRYEGIGECVDGPTTNFQDFNLGWF